MNQEMQAEVVTAEPTEINTAEPAVEQEVAAPEAEQHEAPVVDEAKKALEATKRRIDRLTADKYRTKAENEQLKAEREHLRQQLAAIQGGSQETDNNLSEQDIEAIAEQRANEKLNAKQINDKCNEVAAEGKKAFKGEFDTALKELAEETGPLFDARGKPVPLMEAILDTDAPHKILHHLGTNPELAAEIAEMSPRQQVRRLAKLEMELDTKPVKQTSSAPKPLQPAKAAAASASPNPKTDPEAWIKWRNQQTNS